MFPFIQQNDLENFGAARVMTNYLRSSLVHDRKKELWKDICGTGLLYVVEQRLLCSLFGFSTATGALARMSWRRKLAR